MVKYQVYLEGPISESPSLKILIYFVLHGCLKWVQNYSENDPIQPPLPQELNITTPLKAMFYWNKWTIKNTIGVDCLFLFRKIKPSRKKWYRFEEKWSHAVGYCIYYTCYMYNMLLEWVCTTVQVMSLQDIVCKKNNIFVQTIFFIEL